MERTQIPLISEATLEELKIERKPKGQAIKELQKMIKGFKAVGRNAKGRVKDIYDDEVARLERHLLQLQTESKKEGKVPDFSGGDGSDGDKDDKDDEDDKDTDKDDEGRDDEKSDKKSDKDDGDDEEKDSKKSKKKNPFEKKGKADKEDKDDGKEEVSESVVRLPANIEDVRMSTLYTLLHKAVTAKALKLPATAPVGTQMIKSLTAIGKVLNSPKNSKLTGVEAVKVFGTSVQGHFLATMPPMSTIAKKYKLKIDFSGNLVVEGMPRHSVNMTGTVKPRDIKVGATFKVKKLKDKDNGAKVYVSAVKPADKTVIVKFGGEHGTRRGQYKWSELVSEEASVGAGTIPTGPESVGVKVRKPDFNFKGMAGFDCPGDKFTACLRGKKSGQHWNTFLSRDDELVGKVKDFMGQSYKNTNFMLRNANTGEMVVARRKKVNESFDGTMAKHALRKSALQSKFGVDPDNPTPKTTKEAVGTIAKIAQGKKLMALGDPLKKMFGRRNVSYSDMQFPVFTVTWKGGKIHIVNKKYADKPDKVVGEIAIGVAS